MEFGLLFGRGNDPAIGVQFSAMLSVTRVIMRFNASKAKLTILTSSVALLILRVVSTLSKASSNDHSANSNLFGDDRLLFQGLAALRYRTRVLYRLRRTLINSKERGKDKLQDSMDIILSARRVNYAALISVFLLLNVRMRLTEVTGIINRLIDPRANHVIAASLVSAHSWQDEAIRLASGRMEVNYGAAFGMQAGQDRRSSGRMFINQVCARLYSHAGRREASMRHNATLMKQGRALVRLRRFLRRLLRAFNERLKRRSTATNTLRAYHVLVRTRRSGLTVKAAVDLRALGDFLSVIRADDYRICIGDKLKASFRFAPRSIAMVAPCVVVYQRMSRERIYPVCLFRIYLFIFLSILQGCEGGRRINVGRPAFVTVYRSFSSIYEVFFVSSSIT